MDGTDAEAKHIGVVACSAEGAALCYRTICTEGPARLGPYAHPRVTIHSPSLAAYVRCLEADDWPGVAGLMLDSAERLARVGADCLICPDNTIHQALPLIEADSPLPWLHIAEVVAVQAEARGFRRLGITGTRWLVESGVYPAKLAGHGIEHLEPDLADRSRLDRIIMDELVYGRFEPSSIAFLRDVLERLRVRGADAVVLGCTELPLAIDPSTVSVPILDSTRLLARAALDWAITHQS